MADKDFKVKQGLDLGVPLPIAEGGTGQTTAINAINALLPVQSGENGKYLTTDGTNTSWATVSGVSLSGGSVVTISSSSVIGQVIKGASGQTADLQQWQNSAGTVLVEVTANGGLELNGKDIELLTIAGAL